MCKNNVSSQWDCTASVLCLTFETIEMGVTHFIWSGLWLQHPDRNPVNCKVCIEIQQQEVPKEKFTP